VIPLGREEMECATFDASEPNSRIQEH